MKITLIRPHSGIKLSHPFSFSSSYSLCLLKAYLDTHTTFDTDVIDLNAKEYDNEGLLNALQQVDADLFGITCLTASRFEVVAIAEYLKKLRPRALVVVGGLHVTYCDKETLEKVPFIDIVVRGEGEEPLKAIAIALDQGTRFSHIPSITYRNGSAIQRNPDGALLEDIEISPVFPRDIVTASPEFLRNYPKKIPALSVLSSRGCPGGCVFCSKPFKGYRVRDPKKVVCEIKSLKETFGIKGINFLDLSFTGNSGNTYALCEELIRKKVSVYWWCENRADISLALLPVMKKAGCVSISVGVESASQRVLSQTSKWITTDRVMRLVRRCNELGIYIEMFFMYSLPNETEEDALETLRFIEMIHAWPFVVNCGYQPTMIFPGAPLESTAREKKILPDDFSWYEHRNYPLNELLGQIPTIPLYIEKMRPEALIRLHDERIKQRACLNKYKKNAAGALLYMLRYNPSVLLWVPILGIRKILSKL